MTNYNTNVILGLFRIFSLIVARVQLDTLTAPILGKVQMQEQA